MPDKFIRIKEDIHRRLKRFALNRGLKLTFLAERAIREFLEKALDRNKKIG